MTLKTTKICILCYILSLCNSSTVDVSNATVTTITTDIYPPLNNVGTVTPEVYISKGGLQVNLLNSKQLLVTVCTHGGLNLSAAIGTLPIDNLNQPVTVLYGNPSTNHSDRYSPANFIDGNNATMQMVRPEYLYQTSDKKAIFFTDQASCLRKIDRVTQVLTTLIGVGQCGNSTLDWDSSISGKGWYFQERAIDGMTYYEAAKTWFFSIENNGVFAYFFNTVSGSYEGRLLIKMNDLSHVVTDVNKQLVISGDVIWHKIKSGLNKYNVSRFEADGTGTLDYIDGSFTRQLSATANRPTDYTAVHQFNDTMRELGDYNAEFGILPFDPANIMMADSDLNRLYFYNWKTGDVSTMCSNGPTPVDGNATECRFNSLIAAVWVDEYKILVYESTYNLMRIISWPLITTVPPKSPPTEKTHITTVTSKPPTIWKRMTNVLYAVKDFMEWSLITAALVQVGKIALEMWASESNVTVVSS